MNKNMREFLIEELPEYDAEKVESAIQNWYNVKSKTHPNTKMLRIPIIDSRGIFNEGSDLIVWYVYDLQQNKLYLEEDWSDSSEA